MSSLISLPFNFWRSVLLLEDCQHTPPNNDKSVECAFKLGSREGLAIGNDDIIIDNRSHAAISHTIDILPDSGMLGERGGVHQIR